MPLRPAKIKAHTMACSIIVFFGWVSPSRADSWIEPTWKQMLDSSHVVALIEYTSRGNFRASAKILTVYKGNVKAGDEIWIAGFSNRYGPIDKVRYGDKYLVFLDRNRYVEAQDEDPWKWTEYVWMHHEVDIETLVALAMFAGAMYTGVQLIRSVLAGKSRQSVI